MLAINQEKHIEDVKSLQITLLPIMMEEWHINGTELQELLSKYDLLKYIEVCYDYYNSMGIRGILDDLYEYIKLQGGKITNTNKEVTISMKHYKLSDLKVGMKVFVDELTDIEGVYILLSDTEDVETSEGFTRTTGIISKISDRKLQVKHLKESLYFRRKGYSKFFE